MAIAKPKRPTLIVFGQVMSVDSRVSTKTGEVYKHDITIESPDKGLLSVDFWERDGVSADLPPVLANVALVAEVSESAQYGAALGFVRWATPNDVDLIASAASLVPAKG